MTQPQEGYTTETSHLHQAFRLVAADQATVGFDVDTKGVASGGPVVFISTDPRYGTLDIQISNGTDQALAYDTASSVRIYMGAILSAGEISKISVAGSDWKWTAEERTLEVKPGTPGAIPPRATISIRLQNVLASGEATTGHFRFDYDGFGGDTGAQRLTVFRQHPPASSVPLPIGQSFGVRAEYREAQVVFATPSGAPEIQNYLLLHVVNQNVAAPIRLGPDGRGKIVLAFVSGTSRSALCTDEQLKEVKISVEQTDPGIDWDIEKDVSGVSTVFTLRAGSGNVNFLKAGGITTFRIVQLVTTLDPKGASPLFIQYSGLPGFNDTHVAVLVEKAPPEPFVQSFEASSGQQKLPYDATVKLKEDVELSWSVFAASGCHLNTEQGRLPAVGKARVRPAEPVVTYSLIPEVMGREYPAVSRRLNVAPATASIKTNTAQIVGGESVSVSWECDSGVCTLSGDGPTPIAVPLVGSRAVTPQGTTDFQIDCVGLQTATARVRVRVTPYARLAIDWYKDGSGRWGFKAEWDVKAAGSFVINYVHGYRVLATQAQGFKGQWFSGPVDIGELVQGPSYFLYRLLAQGDGYVEVRSQPTGRVPGL